MNSWQEIEIESIEDIEEISDVYDIEVNKTNCFFANGILVHNCLAGLGSFLILRDQEKSEFEILQSLEREFKPLLDIFGPERAYVEIQFNALPQQKIVNEYLVKFAKKFGFKVVATADSHYARPEWWKDREIYRLLSRQTKGYKVSKDDIPKSIDELKCELYPKNGTQVYETYKKYNPELDENLVKEAIQRSYEIAHHQIESVKSDKTIKLPVLVKNPDQKLEELAWEGLKQKNLHNNTVYKERLKKELDVVSKKGYSSYFLIYKDAMDAIRKEQLLGCGRGSSGGSLLAYVTEITQIDPIKHNCIFERFLSENRNDFVDIDSDSSDKNKTVDILRKKFGEEKIVPITNFNTHQLKSLVKAIAKLHNLPFDEVNTITRNIENEAKWKILADIGNDQKLYELNFENAMKHSPSFSGFIEKYPEIAESIKVLFKQYSSMGRHASGIAVLSNELADLPLIRVGGETQTPFPEGLTIRTLEDFGIIKFDFLAIKTLKIIELCIERILKNQNKDFSFENIRKFYNENLHPDIVGQGDINVFKSIYWSGKFFNVFQFTESGVQQFCTQSKPKCITDISAITSIYRPGPLHGGMDKMWIEVVNGEKQKDHPLIEQILKSTNGLIIYQENFMQLAHELAGFSLSEADDLRKLLSKPATSLGDELKKKRIEVGEKFINRCIEKGIPEKRAKKLWHEEILGHISYSFNFSHAISYSYNSYACAWLLHYFPNEWICASLDFEMKGKAEEKSEILSNLMSMGYKISLPDINLSTNQWEYKNGKFFAPLNLIKSLGEKVEPLVIENQPYSKLEDLIFNEKIPPGMLNKTKLKVLSMCGALSSLQDERFDNDRHMFIVLSDVRDLSKRKKYNFDKHIENEKGKHLPFTKEEKLAEKSSLMGYYDLSEVIPASALKVIKEENIPTISDAIEYELDSHFWFIILSMEEKISKSNNNKYMEIQTIDSSFKNNTIKLFGYTNINLQKNAGYIATASKYTDSGIMIFNAYKNMEKIF